MIRARTFVYDAQLDCVVEVLTGSLRSTSFEQLHDRTKDEHTQRRESKTGEAVKQISLERAERREFAHKTYGDERRWKE